VIACNNTVLASNLAARADIDQLPRPLDAGVKGPASATPT
jgi:hypothetical protein